MSYVIGIDGGTESLRADIFDLSGRCVASVKTPYETHFPSPGHAEQNPDEWWKQAFDRLRCPAQFPNLTCDKPSHWPKKRKKSVPSLHLTDTMNRTLKRTYRRANREKVDE